MLQMGFTWQGLKNAVISLQVPLPLPGGRRLDGGPRGDRQPRRGLPLRRHAIPREQIRARLRRRLRDHACTHDVR